MDNNKNNPNQLNIELDPEQAEGIYSNLAVITHSNSEFIVDFVRILPAVNTAKVKSRIVLTPQHAKRLMNALKDNVDRFEKNFGPIKDVDSQQQMPLTFGGPKGQA